MMNEDVLTESKQTKTGDSENTPENVKDWIVNKILVESSQMWNQCPYNPNWTSGRDYDIYAEDWCAANNWVNPPFSRGQTTIIKALIEFIKGRSSVLLIPM